MGKKEPSLETKSEIVPSFTVLQYSLCGKKKNVEPHSDISLWNMVWQNPAFPK